MVLIFCCSFNSILSWLIPGWRLVPTHTGTSTWMHSHTHTLVHTHIQTHTQTHTHTHTNFFPTCTDQKQPQRSRRHSLCTSSKKWVLYEWHKPTCLLMHILTKICMLEWNSCRWILRSHLRKRMTASFTRSQCWTSKQCFRNDFIIYCLEQNPDQWMYVAIIHSGFLHVYQSVLSTYTCKVISVWMEPMTKVRLE